MVEPSEPGIRHCMRCQWLFVSPDILRIRRCVDCVREEEHFSIREIRSADDSEAQLFTS